MKYGYSLVTGLYLLAISVVWLVPASRSLDSPLAYLSLLSLIELAFLISYARHHQKSSLLLIWDILSRLNLTHPVLLPPPENVFHVFITQRRLMIQGVISSLKLLAAGTGLALITGVALGLPVGWIPRLRQVVLPIANCLSPIPPLVYTPYVVAVMPSFKAASIFVIFCAVFWPTFQNMAYRAGNIDRRIIQSAQVMAVSTPGMLFKVILPYCLPGIMASLNGSIRVALLCLTGAELLGASSGLGYFVKKYSDYADYTKVIAGIILMGAVVTLLISLLRRLQQVLVRWQDN
ncbi:ABC transporter permease subunit [Oscillospiraceae bacterium HV4-5-C5C]|nr:ABC transporter permease subunit [Oscillospiraceae bacterium HV4-5-C5C]